MIERKVEITKEQFQELKQLNEEYSRLNTKLHIFGASSVIGAVILIISMLSNNNNLLLSSSIMLLNCYGLFFIKKIYPKQKHLILTKITDILGVVDYENGL